MGFRLEVGGWTVIDGFGQHGPCLVDRLLYLIPEDKHRCAFAPIETINALKIKEKNKLCERFKRNRIDAEHRYIA